MRPGRALLLPKTRRSRIALAGVLITLIVSTLAIRLVYPARALPVTTTYSGADDTQVQNAVQAAAWPQQKDNWCGVSTVAAIARYHNATVTQQNVADYLNSQAAVSEWGTPTYSGMGPSFLADIARDGGTDPRSLAAGLAQEVGQPYHQLVALSSAYDATTHLVADVVRAKEPISVIVHHGLHSVLVSGVYATGDPVANPSSVTALVVWDPGVNSTFGSIQSTQRAVVPINTWLTDLSYWGAPYDANYFGSVPFDPDPAVGAYTYDPTKDDNAHLWITHYVYLRPDASTDLSASVNVDWAFSQSGALIEGFHGELPTGYTGPTVPIPNKFILNDESIDAPALWTEAAYQPTAGTYTPVSAMAWTGTDGAHHLNVSLSADGIHYDHKITLGETSYVRPAITVVPTSTANVVVIGWRGTDQRLNVLYDVYGALGTPRKATFNETSSYAPALTYFAGQIWLAWTGTNSGHSLNVRALGPQGMTPGNKATLWQDSSVATPALTADVHDNLLLLSWCHTTSSGTCGQLDMVQSPDGVNWTETLSTPSRQTSGMTPPAMALTSPSGGMVPYYWAWIGTDRAHSLNLMDTATLNSWQSPAIILSDTSISSPALGYVGQNRQILLAWTGTDGAHHMNIAILAV